MGELDHLRKSCSATRHLLIMVIVVNIWKSWKAILLIVHGNHANVYSMGLLASKWWCQLDMVSHLVRHMSHLFQLGETCVSPFSIPGSNTAKRYFAYDIYRNLDSSHVLTLILSGVPLVKIHIEPLVFVLVHACLARGLSFSLGCSCRGCKQSER